MRNRGLFLAVSLGAAALASSFVAGCDNETDVPMFTAGSGGLGMGTGGAETGGAATGGDGGCPSDQTVCDDRCVTLTSDRDNCGACGNACDAGNLCFDSECVVSCPGTLEACAGTCIDFQSDDANCGACGTVCGQGEACFEGECTVDCPPNLLECGGTCVDPSTDPRYCGATSCEVGLGMGGASGDGEVCTTSEACISGECREFIREWSTGERVDTAPEDVGREQSIGIDADGNAVALWRQKTDQADAQSFRVYAANYDSSTRSWGDPVRLDPNNDLRVRNLSVAVGSSGHAVATWVEGVGWDESPKAERRNPNYAGNQDNRVAAAVYDPETGTWSEAVKISAVQGDPGRDTWAFVPQVDVDGEGKALVVWSQLAPASPTNPALIFKTFRAHLADGIFSAPEAFPSLNEGDAEFARLDSNKLGQAVVSWREFDTPTTRTAVVVKGNIEAGSWGTPTDIRVDTGLQAGSTDVAINDAGTIMAVWTGAKVPGNFQSHLVRRRYTGVWGPEVVDAGTINGTLIQDYLNARVTIAASGDATVALERNTRDGNTYKQFEVIAYRFNASDSSWGPLTTLTSTVLNAAAGPRISVDGMGNVFVGWVSPTGARASRYNLAQAAWVGPVTLSATPTVTNSPTIAVAANGDAFVTWVENDTDARPHLFVATYD